MDNRNRAIVELGKIVAEHRVQHGLTQEKVAELVGNSNRSEIAYLEEGQRLPRPERLGQICETLKIPSRLWQAAVHPQYLHAMQFQALLGELLGKPLSLVHLDEVAQSMAVDSIAQLISIKSSPAQAFAHFNSVLTFYGEKYCSQEFFDHVLTEEAFSSVESFEQRVRAFQKIGLRLFGNFRRCWKLLSRTSNFSLETKALRPIPTTEFAERREFQTIDLIDNEGLDDLGYISVERANKERLEREEVAAKLRQVAQKLRIEGVLNASHFPTRFVNRLRTLLRTFDSAIEFDVSPSLFGSFNAKQLDDEADRLAPRGDPLAKIEVHRKQGLRNLSAYLTEPYMDVYVATSMRTHADYVSVNSFVETVFTDPALRMLKLRYFNPTQSFIEDRVAKGLVEALMLRRSRLTVYMAQKSDTFGKDSEASVALGQGKPVIVYVPKIADASGELDSDRLFRSDDSAIASLMKDAGIDEEDGMDRKERVRRVLAHRMHSLPGQELSQIVARLWADFDLYGEVNNMPELLRKPVRQFLDSLVSTEKGRPFPVAESIVAAAIIDCLSRVCIIFEDRARLFRDAHPLALQVIVESGVLNGILVVRSAKTCAEVMYRLITNTIETEVVVEESNFRLVERLTGSTLRVISRHTLLTNAFWTQYFPDEA